VVAVTGHPTAALLAVEQATPAAPPGERCGEIAPKVPYATGYVGQLLACLLAEGRLACSGRRGGRRYWRLTGALILALTLAACSTYWPQGPLKPMCWVDDEPGCLG